MLKYSKFAEKYPPKANIVSPLCKYEVIHPFYSFKGENLSHLFVLNEYLDQDFKFFWQCPPSSNKKSPKVHNEVFHLDSKIFAFCWKRFGSFKLIWIWLERWFCC